MYLAFVPSGPADPKSAKLLFASRCQHSGHTTDKQSLLVSAAERNKSFEIIVIVTYVDGHLEVDDIISKGSAHQANSFTLCQNKSQWGTPPTEALL